MIKDLENKEYFSRAALLAADWYVNTISTDTKDPNYGRASYCRHIASKEVSFYGGSFGQGIVVLALLAAYRRTGRKKYLVTAKLAGKFIKKIQIMDKSKPEMNGAILELDPHTQDEEYLKASHLRKTLYPEESGLTTYDVSAPKGKAFICPRDGITGALAFLSLYRETNDSEYLERALSFTKWWTEKGRDKNGWPYRRIEWNSDGKPTLKRFLMCAYEAGDILFLYNLYKVTGNKLYLKPAQLIADQWLEKLQRPDGSLISAYADVNGIYKGALDLSLYPPYYFRHQFNDDFSLLGMLSAYQLFKKEKYLLAAVKFADWLIKHQSKEGSFHTPQYYSEKENILCVDQFNSASATSIILMTDLYKITKDEKYLLSSLQSARHLLQMQHKEPSDKAVHGGFYGFNEFRKEYARIPVGEHHWECIETRPTAYGITALLKLEGKVEIPYYSIYGW